MKLTECHGFLTAVLSSPTLIMPSQWQPMLFRGEPEFSSMEEATDIIQLIGRFDNQISNELRQDSHFEPWIFDPKENKSIPYQNASFHLIKEWCKSYLAGSRLDPNWRQDKTAVTLLLPFGVLSEEFDLKGEKDNEGNIITDDLIHKERMKEKLPLFIKDLFNRFQEHRKMKVPLPDFYMDGEPYSLNRKKLFPDQLIINAHKTGRNDPCICGSGNKYKKCCLNKNEMVH